MSKLHTIEAQINSLRLSLRHLDDVFLDGPPHDKLYGTTLYLRKQRWEGELANLQAERDALLEP